MAGHDDDEIERLRSALVAVVRWAEAYPLSAFPEPDLEKVAELLRAGGVSLDSVSAANIRHVVEGVGEIARKALRREPLESR
jgi:hypothetical protein